MSSPTKNWQSIQEKIQELPGDKVEEIFDFIDFVYRKEKLQDTSVTEDILRLQQESLSRIWDDEEELYPGLCTTKTQSSIIRLEDSRQWPKHGHCQLG